MTMVYVTNLTIFPVTFDEHTLLTLDDRVGPVLLTGKIKALQQQGLVSYTELDVISQPMITPKPLVITASTLTLVPAYNGRILEFMNACVVTLPNNLRDSFSCVICQKGAGAVSLSAWNASYYHQLDSATILAGRYAEITLRVSSNADGESADYIASGAFL